MSTGWDCKSKLFYWCGGGGEDKNNSVRTVNIFLAFFFLENYVLGTGFLGIPFAIFHSGLLYGAVTMIVITFVSWNCAVYTVESMARAQVRRACKKLGHFVGGAPLPDLYRRGEMQALYNRCDATLMITNSVSLRRVT